MTKNDFEEVGKFFIEKTKYRNLTASDQMKGISQPTLELEVDNNDKTIIDLPSPKSIKINEIGLRIGIERRKTRREYSQKPITLEELSFLLWCTQGVKEVIPNQATLRTVPSAGARHAFETYLVINNVKDLEGGLYRFLATKHKLTKLFTSSNLTKELTSACLDQEHVKNSAATFVWVAIVNRMTWRYGQRGYRYLYLDAGHICQNLYLAAEAIGAGVCAIAAFDDDKVNEVLGLDGEKKIALYLATVGKI